MMTDHYTCLLQHHFDIRPDSVMFDRSGSGYDVDCVVERHTINGSYVELWDDYEERVFLNADLVCPPSFVHSLLGMKAWSVIVDDRSILRMDVDDSMHKATTMRLGVNPYPDVRVRREHMAGQTITEVVFQYCKRTVELSVWSGGQLLVCAVRLRGPDEVAALFSGE